MPGRVYKRNEVWWISFYDSGKEYRTSAKTTKKRDAEKLLVHYMAQVARRELKGFATETPYTVDDMLDDLIADCTRRKLRDVGSVERRTRYFRRAFGAMSAKNLSERSVDNYIKLRQNHVADATVQKELRYLKQAMRIAYRKRLIDRILHLPTIKIENTRQGFFEHDEFLRVVSFLPDYLHDIVRFGYYSGWRKGEITSLEWRDVRAM